MEEPTGNSVILGRGTDSMHLEGCKRPGGSLAPSLVRRPASSPECPSDEVVSREEK